MERKVEGVYPTVDEALRAIERLREEGYSQDNITLVANEEVRTSINSDIDTEVKTKGSNENTRNDDENNQSFWDSIKDAFTTDDSYNDSNYDDPNYNLGNDPIYEYRDSINEGQVAVLVSGEPDGMDTELTGEEDPMVNSDSANKEISDSEPRDKDITRSEPIDSSPMESDIVNPGPAKPRGPSDPHTIDQDTANSEADETADNRKSDDD